MTTQPAISPQDFQFLRELLRDQIGYHLTDDKGYLIESRLGPVAAMHELPGVAELLERLRRTGDRTMRDTIVQAMTINETYFFRATNAFESLRRLILPDLLKTRAATRRVRIWCAACSTGQEPYSIAMTLADHFLESEDWQFDILATKSVFGRLRCAIAHDGYLVLGESETILGMTDQFTMPDGGGHHFRPVK